MHAHLSALSHPISTSVAVRSERQWFCVEFHSHLDHLALSHNDAAVLIAALRDAADKLEAATKESDPVGKRSAQARRDGCCGNPIPGSDAVCDKTFAHMGPCGLVGAAAVYGGAA